MKQIINLSMSLLDGSIAKNLKAHSKKSLGSPYIQGDQTKCRQIFIQITKKMLLNFFSKIIVYSYIEIK